MATARGPFAFGPSSWFPTSVPAPVAPWIGLLIGIAFALASTNELARSPSGAIGTRGLLVASLFGLAIAGPCAAYFLTVAPDWSWAYLLAPGDLTRAMDFGAALCAAASVPAGYLLSARAAGARNLRPIARLALIPALITALLTASFAHRWSVYATYSQYHGSFGARPLAGSWLGYSVLWSAFVIAASSAWALRAVFRATDPSRSR